MSKVSIGQYLRELFLHSTRKIFLYFEILGIATYFFSELGNIGWLKILSLVIVIVTYFSANYSLYKQVYVQFGNFVNKSDFVVYRDPKKSPYSFFEIFYNGNENIHNFKIIASYYAIPSPISLMKQMI